MRLVVIERITLDGVVESSRRVVLARRRQGCRNTTVLRGTLRDQVERLKRRPGNDLGLTGSISVVRQLIEARLVDEYRLFTYPAVEGRGKRLFVDGADLPKLKLIEAKPFRSGIVLLTHRPA